MVKGHREFLHCKINDFTLIYAMRVLQRAKMPPFIPLYEVMTYRQISEYFNVSEKRLRNIVSCYRNRFNDDYTELSGREVGLIAIDKKDMGCHYGWSYTFSNGVKVHNIAYGTNIVFNARAILHFALYLYDESAIAKGIADLLHKAFYQDLGKVDAPRLKQWFFYEEPQNETNNPDATGIDIHIHITTH